MALLNADIQRLLDSQTDAWGIKVANVEIKHVDIDESMIRAIARQAEVERERRVLQTLTDIAGDKSSTIVFPESMELMNTQTRFAET